MLKTIRILLTVMLVTMATTVSAQTISGTVKDSDGEAVIGASILEKGTSNGTVTDINGNFTLKVSGKKNLVISYVGMETTEVNPAGKTKVNVTLKNSGFDLNDVVVIGYGAVKKRDLTGAVSSVKAEDIVRTPTTNIMEAIQGQVAGFDITRTNGEVGAPMNLTLRGNRSIYGNNAPLFIIDGMEGAFDELNPNDIESIEVLKDASSTAIYGAAGANGVVIVTTKNAKNNKFEIKLDAYAGWNKVTSFPEVRTGQEYIDFRREAMRASGNWSSPADDATIFPANYQSLIDNNQWVDWFKEGSQTGSMQEYNLSTSYASDKMNSFASLNYSNTQGTLKGDALKRYSLRTRMDFMPNKIVKYGLNLYAMYGDNDKRNSRIWNRMMCTPPLGVPYNEDGTINYYPIEGDGTYPTPLTDMGQGQYVNNIKTISIAPQAYFEVEPLKGLSYKTVLGGYFRNQKHGVYQGIHSWSGLQDGQSTAETPNQFTYNYKWQNILSYLWDINDDHHLTFTGVTEWSKGRMESSNAIGHGFDTDDYAYHNLSAGTGTPAVESAFVQTQMMSYIIRAMYSYKSRYLLTLSNRWDGSSKLSSGHKWDSFPAVAVGWRLSEESFMKATKSWLDNLKIRASYGVTGNDGLGAYGTLAYSQAGMLGFQETGQPYSTYSTNISNLGLGWEKSYSWDIGLDATLLNNRIDVVFDWYRTDTKDLLYQRGLPAATGGTVSGTEFTTFSIWQNVGKTRNTGIEVAINSRNILNKNFQWSTSATFSTNSEKVIATTSVSPLQFNDFYLIEGQPIHTYYMYKYLGIWKQAECEQFEEGHKPTPGTIHIEDVNGDGKYTEDDYQIVGNATPKWMASLSNFLTYKWFDLSFQFIARWNYTMRYGITGWYRNDGINPVPRVCDYYTPENENARYPRPNSGTSQDTYQGNSSINFFDGSYIKLKNITFGYTLPQSVLKAIKIEKARLYFTASNPFIWTKCSYLKNYDPEKGGNDDDAPLSKQFVFGINLTF